MRAHERRQLNKLMGSTYLELALDFAAKESLNAHMTLFLPHI